MYFLLKRRKTGRTGILQWYELHRKLKSEFLRGSSTTLKIAFSDGCMAAMTIVILLPSILHGMNVRPYISLTQQTSSFMYTMNIRKIRNKNMFVRQVRAK